MRTRVGAYRRKDLAPLTRSCWVCLVAVCCCVETPACWRCNCLARLLWAGVNFGATLAPTRISAPACCWLDFALRGSALRHSRLICFSRAQVDSGPALAANLLSGSAKLSVPKLACSTSVRLRVLNPLTHGPQSGGVVLVGVE